MNVGQAVAFIALCMGAGCFVGVMLGLALGLAHERMVRGQG